ncbi:hypothetical protein KEM56_002646 [Ascosphaera pollenicola]|nr:hypothetical protein KEM56_002646 [Ascosphaera pollenicola]
MPQVKMYSPSSPQSSYGSRPSSWGRPAELKDPDVLGILKLHNAANGDRRVIAIPFGKELIIGRDPKICGFTITGPHISNKHIRIYSVVFDTAETSEVGGEGIKPLVYAEDISSNGSWWNGQRMGYRRGSVLLSTGDVLTLANGITLIYESKDEEEDVELGALVRSEIPMFENDFIISHRCIGVGGYGSVYVAFDKKQKRQVACKIINLKGIRERIKVLRQASQGLDAADTTKEVLARKESAYLRSKMEVYDREALILQGLDHGLLKANQTLKPNIISVERIYKTPNTIYIFEELITAGDLFSFLEFKGGKLDDVETAVIVYQILKGLEYLHSNNMAHRDLKPDNVLMTSLHSGYRVVLTDFGCAKRLPPAKRMMSVMGTAEYIAPEINRQKVKANNSGDGYTVAVDIWSLGCLTTVLLTGGSPFLDPNTMQYNPELAAAGNLIALERDPDWLSVGLRAKDFVRRCLVLIDERRMSATEALGHPWFANKAHKEEFEKVYRRAVAGWRPRHRAGKGIMYVIDADGVMSPVKPWSEERVEKSCLANTRQDALIAGKTSVHVQHPNGKAVHFEDEVSSMAKKENMRALTMSSDENEGDEQEFQMTTANADSRACQERGCPDVDMTVTPPLPQCAEPIFSDGSREKRPAQSITRAQMFGFDASAWD